jgi:phosphoglucomutase
MEKENITSLLEVASKQINRYLDRKHKEGIIREELYFAAKESVIKNLKEWLEDKYIDLFFPNLKEGIKKAIKEKRWEDIIFAFLGKIAFGTAGIRGIVAFTQKELEELKKRGLKAKILKGPNTINEITFSLTSIGVANFLREKKTKSVVIGYDSRIQGKTFAHLIAKLFLAKKVKVYLFDEPSPYPEVSFAVPFLNANLGIIISASHNDKRYNGYKISSETGAGLDINTRNYIFENFIKKAKTEEIELIDFEKVSKESLIFLGGEKKLPKENYFGKELINIHKPYLEHVKKFIKDRELIEKWGNKLNIGYSAYHGAGRKFVPFLLKEMGFKNIKIIHSLNKLDGTFPCFAFKQQPDPGDPLAAEIAVREFKKEYGKKEFQKLDILLGTDPDADRVALIVKIPKEQQKMYAKFFKIAGFRKNSDYSWILLDADTVWSILVWYRLEKEKINGKVKNANKKFIVLNHLTTDMIVKLAQKYGIGVVKTWVGFSMIAEAVKKVWEGEKLSREKFPQIVFETYEMDERRKINIAALEQSSGFSILGGPPLPGEKLGEGGHIRDKDGTLAALLLAELAAFAKSQEKTIIDLVDEKLYLDPEIGCFINHYEPIPYWGEFEGPTGLSQKIEILKRADKLKEEIKKGKKISLAGLRILSAEAFCTGKYDQLHRWKGFPDEGIRFYFDNERENYLTIRPSGTSHCIRIHVQLRAKNVNRKNLLEKKIETRIKAVKIVREAKKIFGIKS